MRVNLKALARQVFTRGKKVVTNSMNRVMEARFNAAKSKLLRSVEDHVVSRELLGGIASRNISGTLGGVHGNLYSYFGFKSGSSPVDELKQFLDEYITFERMDDINWRGVTSFDARVPTYGAFKVLNLPWQPGLSWVWAIEDGSVGNLGAFIYDTMAPNSRSGGGIQMQKDIRSATFKPIPYMTPILNEFMEGMAR